MAPTVSEAVVVGATGGWLAKLAGVLTGSVDAKGKIGWADAGSEIIEVVVIRVEVESGEDEDKLGQDIPEEEAVTVGEVVRAGVYGTDIVTRRMECCVDGGGAERGHTADTAYLRGTVG